MAGGSAAGFADGFGCLSRFRNPQGLALRPDRGALIICDSWNHRYSTAVLTFAAPAWPLICLSSVRRIREVDLLSNVVQTLAGDGSCADTDGEALIQVSYARHIGQRGHTVLSSVVVGRMILRQWRRGGLLGTRSQ